MIETAIARMTFEEFIQLPEEDIAYELVDGQREPLVSPKMIHSKPQTRLARYIDNYLGDDFTGFFGTELDFPTIPFHGRRPDLIYYAPEHVSEEDWERGYPLDPPDLVIEVVSPDDTVRDYLTKRSEYARTGIARYWIVDPQIRAVEMLLLSEPGEYRPEARFTDRQVLTTPLFPGLRVPLSQIFR